MKEDSTIVYYLIKICDALNLFIHRVRFSPEISVASKINFADIRNRQDRIIEAVNTCVNEIRKLHRLPIKSAVIQNRVNEIENDLHVVIQTQSKYIYEYIKDIENEEEKNEDT